MSITERKFKDGTNFVFGYWNEIASPRVSVSAKKWCSSGSLIIWKVIAVVMVFFVMALGAISVHLLMRKLYCTAPGGIVGPKFPSLQNGVLDGPSSPVYPQTPSGAIDGTEPSKLRFVERAEWGAQPPTEPLTRLKRPVPYVIISHTHTEFCKTQSECTFRVRFAQTFHIESRNWSDIAYNFLVGGDGFAYVGRGWDFVGAHSYNYNTRSIGISFIGTFNDIIPPEQQLRAAQELIAMGVKAGKIATDYKLIGHRQVSRTSSPGDTLYNVIKTWPHWTNASLT